MWNTGFISVNVLAWSKCILRFHSLATKTVLNVSPHLSLCIAHFDVEAELRRYSKHHRKLSWVMFLADWKDSIHQGKKPPSVISTKLDLFYLLSTLTESLVTLNFSPPTYPDPCWNYRMITPGHVLYQWGWNQYLVHAGQALQLGSFSQSEPQE